MDNIKFYKWPGKLLITLFVLSIFPWPYGFYQFLRLIAFIIFIYYFLYFKKNKDKSHLYWVLIILSFIYNPIFPIFLYSKFLWIIIDIFSIYIIIKIFNHNIINNMFCIKCGKELEKSSPFCPFCGEKQEDGQKKETSDDELHEKYIESLFDSKKRSEILDKALSDPTEKTLSNISDNQFISFKEANQDALNNLTYKSVEKINRLFLVSSLSGYILYLIEKYPDINKLSKIEDITKDYIDDSFDKLLEDWKEKSKENIPEESLLRLLNTNKFLLDGNLEDHEELQNLTNKTIEDFKKGLFQTSMFGYLISKIEDKKR